MLKVKLQCGFAIALVRDRASGKEDCVAEQVGDDLDDIGIGDVGPMVDLFFERTHDNGIVALHREDGGIDGFRIDERFVALNIDVEGSSFGRSNFGEAVGAGEMRRAGHAHTAPKFRDCGSDAVVIGGYQHVVKITGHRSAFPNMLEHGLASE